MEITKARFITSLADMRDFEGRGLPEIAVSGRSNVGKSSLINSLTRRGNLARTGGTPGVTRLINLFMINEAFILADLPGYGYARAAQTEKKAWGHRIEGYLRDSGNIRLVLQLVDLRHEPSEDDKLMVAWMRHYGVPFKIIATKADKISKARRAAHSSVIVRALAVQPWDVISYSSHDGTGREEALSLIEGALSLPEERN